MILKLMSNFTNGLVRENPTFKLLLGMCLHLPRPLRVQRNRNGACSHIRSGSVQNVIISLIRKFIPNKIRIPCFIVVIATFVTIVDLYMAAFLPDLHNVLGVFVPLMVVNFV